MKHSGAKSIKDEGLIISFRYLSKLKQNKSESDRKKLALADLVHIGSLIGAEGAEWLSTLLEGILCFRNGYLTRDAKLQEKITENKGGLEEEEKQFDAAVKSLKIYKESYRTDRDDDEIL